VASTLLPQVWAEYKEGQLEAVLDEHLLDSDAHQQARELLLQLLKAKPEARLSIHQVSNSVFFGKGVATLKAISNNLAVGGAGWQEGLLPAGGVAQLSITLLT
jgi:hypothetical protein